MNSGASKLLTRPLYANAWLGGRKTYGDCAGFGLDTISIADGFQSAKCSRKAASRAAWHSSYFSLLPLSVSVGRLAVHRSTYRVSVVLSDGAIFGTLPPSRKSAAVRSSTVGSSLASAPKRLLILPYAE